ncbi:MAG: 2-amino-4-hydroxy-6-hydroxymethyldihydropteridine diphosphokinase [Verrucomicrobiales bacterium]|jgi:2-amino-4-hydroxy-6-hydroxymethyldihydropteridine diphosphokinase|nr:2-amino-4-hydroxy-6-hydroxymethyldihydropteridine diphosphokinase [Verrucomicrobiales bacterium]MBP9224709.1 2-amino-4-hydroxy-6-hydroxymethyldihydropteridine diphosphokinase [Verrucomicrobiales bacterium]
MGLVGISLGSNLGDRLGNLRTAVARLQEVQSSGHLLLSSVYETDPVGCPPGSGSFYNAVIEIETELSPHDLLRTTKAIEKALGRPSAREINAPRTVDLDLLYYGEMVLSDGDLVLPHPRMGERAFVLMPLAEIRPDLVPDQWKSEPFPQGIRRLSEDTL